MSCNSCKSKKINILNPKASTNEPLNKKQLISLNVLNFSIRFFIFLISLLFVPIVVLITVYMLFKTIVLQNNDLNMLPAIIKFAKIIKRENNTNLKSKLDKGNNGDAENLDDYELVGVDDISNKNNINFNNVK